MRKFNIALTPLQAKPLFIDCAKPFTSIADQYLLGEHSLPHVTLYQFDIDETTLADLWAALLKTLTMTTITITLLRFNDVTFDGKIFWISLTPDQSTLLHEMHAVVAQVLNKLIKKDFDPHLTLCNTQDKDYQKIIRMPAENYQPISDTFVLSLGHCDAVGQLTQILYQAPFK